MRKGTKVPKKTCFFICPLSEKSIERSEKVQKNLLSPALDKYDIKRSDTLNHGSSISFNGVYPFIQFTNL